MPASLLAVDRAHAVEQLSVIQLHDVYVILQVIITYRVQHARSFGNLGIGRRHGAEAAEE